MIDETSIDLVIQGLKGLYEKLALKREPHDKPAEDDGVWFESEKDKCLVALKDLFLYRLNANREKRLRQNEGNLCLRGVTRVFWVTRIMVFLPLEDCLRMS